jgi:hypothetical protein
MSINITDKPEMNVVNVGDELTQGQINALNASAINGSPTATNPFLTRTNTFTTTDTAVRITQTGTGEAFRVEDQSPDTSPFVITADGRVGIQTTTVGTNALAVTGTIAVAGGITTSAANTFTVASGSTVPLTVTNGGTGLSFRVNDVSGDTSPFVVDAVGNVGVQNQSPAYALDVNGTANVGTLRFGDGTTMTTTPVAGYTPSTDIQNALSGAASPSSSNVFATMADVGGGGGSTAFPYDIGSPLTSGYASFYSSFLGNATMELGYYQGPVGYYKNGSIQLNSEGGSSGNPYTLYINSDYEGNSFFQVYDPTNSVYPIDINYSGITFHNGGSPFGFTSSGLTFPDGTIQSTAASGGGSTAFPYTVGDTSSEYGTFAIANSASPNQTASLTLGSSGYDAVGYFSGTKIELNIGSTMGGDLKRITLNTDASIDSAISFKDAITNQYLIDITEGGISFYNAGTPFSFFNGTITFADATTQTSAPVYSAATVVTGGTADLSSDDYPDEITIVIAGVTYAMPARVVPSGP